MDTDIPEQVKIALNALERLRQVEGKLSAGQLKHLETVRESLRQAKFADAKVGLIRMLEQSSKPEELWLALSFVVLALGENVSNIVDYVKGAPDSTK